MRNKNPEQKAWRQTYLVDRKQLDSFAKDIPKQFSFNSTIPPYSDKISKFLSQAQHSQIRLNKQQTVTFKSLADVVHDIESLRSVLKHYDQTNEYLVKVQNSSENILGKLEQFRGKMGVAYEELADEQETLNDQLELMAKKIDAMSRGEEIHDQKENVKNNNRDVKVWERQQNVKQKSDKKIDSNQNYRLNAFEERMKEKEKAVEATEKAIIALGKNLGWPEQDHNDFVSIWHRGPSHKNYFQIEQQMQGYFAFYTSEQIQEHMNKYIKWKKLTQEKKELIVQYKNLKEQKKIEELKVLNIDRKESRQKWQKQEQKRLKQKEQLQMKAKLGEWKQKKAQQKKQQEERRAQIQYEKKQRQAMKRYQAEERKKEMLEQWKQEQAQKKQQQLRRIKSARKPATIDRDAQERIRLRQQLALQKKLEIVNNRRHQQEMQRQKQSRIKESKFVKYSYVTNKLDKKTTAMRQKQRQKFDGKEKKEANTFGGQLMMTGVRATPSWMK